MSRVLRPLALASLLVFAVVVVWAYAYYASPLNPFEDMLPLLAISILGRTGFVLAFGAGVVAVVAALQQRRRGWAAALLVVVLLAGYGYYLAIPLHLLATQLPYLLASRTELPYGAPRVLVFMAQDTSITQYIPAVVLAGLVLVYSFRPPRGAPSAATLGTEPAGS